MREPMRDYGRSRAVLVGTSEYTQLEPVPAAANSLQRMSRILTSKMCGWPPDRLSVFSNEFGPGDLPDRLITLFEEAQDVALFYFVGHGQIDLDDQLCLGLVGSRPEPHRRAATSLQFHSVRRALLDSPARTKILILDCCFAGLASRPSNTLGTPSSLLDKAAGTGAYTMMASSAYTTAWFETDGQEKPQTYFTKYLADLIETGILGESAELRLRSLFIKLRDNLAHDLRPIPEARVVDGASDFIFARNAALLEDKNGYPEMEYKRLLADLGRRNIKLLHRQLTILDAMEREESDPDRLARLFTMDHLTTRMRRQAEGLLILGDANPPRKWDKPVSIVDVLRAATAEIEDYGRVSIYGSPDAAIHGRAVSDTIHLLAELIENATLFSPSTEKVTVSYGLRNPSSILVSITDRGVGMTREEIELANRRLEKPPPLDGEVPRRMGLSVVSRLAARHDITVRLDAPAAPIGGITALVLLPGTLISDKAESTS